MSSRRERPPALLGDRFDTGRRRYEVNSLGRWRGTSLRSGTLASSRPTFLASAVTLVGTFNGPPAEQPKDHPVKHLLKAAAFALAIAGSTVATLGIATPASAADTVITFDPGTVRYGYNDGYWDTGHAWHTWGAPEHMTTYRAYKGNQYFDYAHTRDANQGWIEK